MSRGEALRQLDQQKVDEQYRRDDILVNLDGRVPLDESSQCYKSAEEVVAAVVAAGLARVEHTLWPLASIKGNEKSARAQSARDAQGQGPLARQGSRRQPAHEGALLRNLYQLLNQRDCLRISPMVPIGTDGRNFSSWQIFIAFF